MHFGIDFRHAVEFSRIGRTPRFALSFEAPGQLAQTLLFRFRPVKSAFFDPVSLRDPVTETRRGVFRLPRPSGSLLEGRPLSRPALRSNKKNITDIRGADANRGPGPLSEAPGTRPRRPSTGAEGSSARPSGHNTHPRLRERHFHHASPRKRFSKRGETTRWEPVNRLPPVKHCTVQETPLGEWPLVAA